MYFEIICVLIENFTTKTNRIGLTFSIDETVYIEEFAIVEQAVIVEELFDFRDISRENHIARINLSSFASRNGFGCPPNSIWTNGHSELCLDKNSVTRLVYIQSSTFWGGTLTFACNIETALSTFSAAALTEIFKR
jgi:hypothetical protein